jgi:hypothetical protein
MPGGGRAAYLFCVALRNDIPTVAVLFDIGQAEGFAGRFRDCMTEVEKQRILQSVRDRGEALPDQSEERAIVLTGYAARAIWGAWADLVKAQGYGFQPPSEWKSLSPRVTSMHLLVVPVASGTRRHWAPDALVGLFCADRKFRAFACYDIASFRSVLRAHAVAVGSHMARYQAQVSLTAMPELDPIRKTVEIGTGPASALFAEHLASWVEFGPRRVVAALTGATVIASGPREEDCC